MPIESPYMTFYMMDICQIGQNLRAIRNQNVLDLELYKGPRSNRSVESKKHNFDDNNNICYISHQLCDIRKSKKMPNVLF